MALAASRRGRARRQRGAQGRRRADARGRAPRVRAGLPPGPSCMKERAEKLESWRKKEKLNEQKKAEQKELLRKKSSMWIAEDKLEAKILEAITHTTPL
ncbi:hypothetical protein ACP70R_021557 [Stipagrostis hirtigluma subsp. patula]